MSSSVHSPATRNRQPTPCRLYSQGLHCRFGNKCRFVHSTDVQPINRGDTHTNAHASAQEDSLAHNHDGSSNIDPGPQTSSHETSHTRHKSKRGDIPCRAWKAGTCAKGAKCWFSHDINKPSTESLGLSQQTSEIPRSGLLQIKEGLSAPPIPDSSRAGRIFPEVAIPCERTTAAAKEEAAKTISQVVFGSIVTYSAGLDVSSLTTGFETCTLRIKNLPSDVKEHDILTLLKDQGVDTDRFHVVIKKKSDRRLEAHIVTDSATGRTLASGLDGAEFQEETLVVELSATNSLDGMTATAGQSSNILTIFWRGPSVRYIAEYVDVAAANTKATELNRFIYGGRRLKVEMNTQPRGRYVPNLRLNAIKISNLPSSVTDQDVISFTGSLSVKRLPVCGPFRTMLPVEQMARLVRADIERAIPEGMKTFDEPHDTCTMEGVVSARAHFSSWDEANTAYTYLSDKGYGIWLRLPDPMHFTLVIPAEQYKAQRAQWDSLSSSIKDRKACSLNVRDSGNVVIVRLSGSVKEATGALKVRVENLARGENVDGWHRSLGISNNSFVTRVYSETGAYLRANWKRQTLKVYGAPGAIERAREMIKDELDRLASLDHTITLAQTSVGFFVREGIQQLKDTLGESNVRFVMSSRKITVSGGEEARHALDRLIAFSHKGNFSLSNASQGSQTCPVCYDDVSSPHHLGCGHTYCVACLRHLISSALESDQLPLVCLGDEARCRVPITIPTIQHFLSPPTFKRLLEAAFDSYIAKHPEEFKHCKTPDCTQIYRVARLGTATQALHCPSCFSAVCNGCHEDVHDGLSCAESKARRDPAELERLNDTWIASQGGRVKKCPQCNVLIEKTQGCNHMTCRCGAHICWRCMRVFTAEMIYPHMHSEHGTIHDDAPAVFVPPDNIGIPIDIEEQRELFRQLEMRRAAQNPNANVAQPWGRLERADRGMLVDQPIPDDAPARMGRFIQAQWQHEAEERQQHEVRGQAWLREHHRQVRQLEERRQAQEQARLRDHRRQVREMEERRQREQEERRNGEWGCTIM